MDDSGSQVLELTPLAATLWQDQPDVYVKLRERLASYAPNTQRALGASLPEIMIAGGWKSPQMPTHYARKVNARQGAMQR